MLLLGFFNKSVHIESVKYQHYQGIYNISVWSHSVSVPQVWTSALHAAS